MAADRKPPGDWRRDEGKGRIGAEGDSDDLNDRRGERNKPIQQVEETAKPEDRSPPGGLAPGERVRRKPRP